MTEPTPRRVPLSTGLSLALLEWDASEVGRDHTLILVHGFLDLAWGWYPMVQAGLAEKFHVVAVDMRGHGDSDRVGAGGYYHFMDYVADLACLIDEVGRARVSLVGHSMGGSIVAYYAGAFARRAERIALLEGLGPPEDETPPPDRTRHWIEAWRRVRSSEKRGHPSVEAAAERLRASDPKLDPGLARLLAEHGTEPLPDGSRRFKHDPLHLTRGPYTFSVALAETYWRRIECPVLLVEGAESPFRGLPDLERRVSCLGNARRVVLEGSGHMLQRHQPKALCRALLDFLG